MSLKQTEKKIGVGYIIIKLKLYNFLVTLLIFVTNY